MSSRSKQKGTAFETLVLGAFRLLFPQAERRTLQGKHDKGDLYLPGEDRFIVECKNVSRFNLAEWKKEADVEAANAGVKVGVVVHKRRGCGQALDQWVTMTVADFLYLVKGVNGEEVREAEHPNHSDS